VRPFRPSRRFKLTIELADPEPMAAFPSESDPLRSIWRRVVDLSPREQLELYVRLRDYLGELAPRSALDDELGTRRQADEHLRRACAELGRAPSDRLTVKDYDEVAQRLSLMPAQAVGRAFGSWKTALEVLAGRRMPQTARQIDARRGAPRGTDRGEHLKMLGEFLATGPRAPTMAAYRNWALEHNRRLAPGDEPRLLPAAILARSGGLRWSELVALACGQASDGPVAESYPIFVALRQVARITGAAYTVVYRRGFPRPVAFSGHAQFWRRDEVFAYRDGGVIPGAEAFALQEELLFTADIARMLGVTSSAVATHVRRQGWQRGLLPEPCSVIPNVQSVWWRAEAEKWLASRPTNGLPLTTARQHKREPLDRAVRG
jgi:predicted DNA-binding transcriptional regulator AlpA